MTLIDGPLATDHRRPVFTVGRRVYNSAVDPKSHEAKTCLVRVGEALTARIDEWPRTATDARTTPTAMRHCPPEFWLFFIDGSYE